MGSMIYYVISLLRCALCVVFFALKLLSLQSNLLRRANSARCAGEVALSRLEAFCRHGA